jgi:hypothetical protein
VFGTNFYKYNAMDIVTFFGYPISDISTMFLLNNDA